MTLSCGGSGQCPLSEEGLGTRRHVAEVVYHNEYLDDSLVGVKEGLKGKGGSYNTICTAHTLHIY